ncbi:serine/threonine transporter [Paludibacterium sp. THUN1379]|nr:serine/threonine transporter [Paludibacterium sp. THUN1379]
MNQQPGIHAGTTQHDVEWVLTLFGTAVGAGILYLPVQAGLGGIWPILILACVSFPVVWLSHRTLTHLVVTHKQPCELPQVVEEDLGPAAGLAVSLLYLAFYLALVVAFATGMINIAATYIEFQLGLEAIPRPILCLLIALGLSAVMLTAGEQAILRITSTIAFPLIAALLFLSIYLIPGWHSSMLTAMPDAWSLGKHLLLIVPVLFFSMDFSAVCAMLAASYRRHYPDARVAMRRSDRAVYWSSLMLLVFVLFFAFSCVMAIQPQDLSYALQHNIDALTLMSLHVKPHLLQFALPLLAFATILHSYFAAFLGARSGLIGLMGQWKRHQHHPEGHHPLEWITTLLVALPLWAFALSDPSILTLIGMIAAPIIALVCYVMPVYVFRRVPRLAIYRERASVLVLLAGLLVMVSYWLGTRL